MHENGGSPSGTNKNNNNNIVEDGKFKARNWKEIWKKNLQNMTAIQRSRYLAYEPPSDPNGVRRCQSRLNIRAKAAAKQQVLK